MPTVTSYTIPTDGTYTTTDGKESYLYKAGTVIPIDLAVRMGLGARVTDTVADAGSLVTLAQLRQETTRIDGYRSPALEQFWSKLATIATDGVDVVTIGDSNTEGGTATDPNKSWTNVMRDELRNHFQPSGVTGGFGYMPSHYVRSFPVDHWITNSGSVSQASSYGLGRRRMTINTNSQIQTTFTGTKIRLFFAKSTGGGNFTVNIDGADTVVSSLGASTLRSQTWDSGTLTVGAHVVKITTTTPALSFEGAMTFNGDESAGIRTWQGGQSAYHVGDFASSEPTNLGIWQDALTTIQPDLVVMMWGTNDYRDGITLAQFRTNLQQLVTDIRTKVTIDPSIVLLVAPERYDTGYSTLATYGAYADVMRSVALEDGRLAYLDLRSVISVNGETNGTGSTDADKVHFTTIGQGMIGRAVAEFLVP